MFQRMINDLKDSTGTALRLTSLAAAAAGALFIATSFLCAAAFVFVYQRYGLVEACLTRASVFLVVAVIAAGCYIARKQQVEARAARAGEPAARAKPLGHFGPYARDRLAGHRQLPIPGLSLPRPCHRWSGRGIAGFSRHRYADNDGGVGKTIQPH